MPGASAGDPGRREPYAVFRPRQGRRVATAMAVLSQASHERIDAALAEAGVDGSLRAEMLAPERFLALALALRNV